MCVVGSFHRFWDRFEFIISYIFSRISTQILYKSWDTFPPWFPLNWFLIHSSSLRYYFRGTTLCDSGQFWSPIFDMSTKKMYNWTLLGSSILTSSDLDSFMKHVHYSPPRPKESSIWKEMKGREKIKTYPWIIPKLKFLNSSFSRGYKLCDLHKNCSLIV